MGNPQSKLTKSEVGDEVAKLGDAYKAYRQVALDNGVDGAMLLALTTKDLEELGVTKSVHPSISSG